MAQDQITEAELIERERMKNIASDADVIAALNRFDNWERKQALHKNYPNGAVPQMLQFLRTTLEAGTSLRNALFERLNQSLDRLRDTPPEIDTRLAYAARYLVDAFRADRNLLNYDPKFFYMMQFVSYSQFNFERHQRGYIKADFNSIFGVAYGNKKSFIHTVAYPRYDADGNPIPIREKAMQEAATLVETDVLSGYYNISFHNNNIGGRATWQEGEEIALGIYKFIEQPQSRGLLCSFLPPSGPVSIDWSQNSWIYDHHLHGWIETEKPQDLLLYFDQMASMPGLYEKVTS